MLPEWLNPWKKKNPNWYANKKKPKIDKTGSKTKKLKTMRKTVVTLSNMYLPCWVPVQELLLEAPTSILDQNQNFWESIRNQRRNNCLTVPWLTPIFLNARGSDEELLMF